MSYKNNSSYSQRSKLRETLQCGCARKVEPSLYQCMQTTEFTIFTIKDQCHHLSFMIKFTGIVAYFS